MSRALLCAAVIVFMVLLMLPLAQERAQAAPGDVLLASSNAAGVKGNNTGTYARISSDGRYVVFHSAATNLVTPATANIQVFRKDLRTGEIRLVSADGAGLQGNANSMNPDISADGRYVAFQSQATNLVTPATTVQHVFRRDMVTGEVKLVSADAAGARGNSFSTIPSMTPDGRYVAFTNPLPISGFPETCISYN
jgi:Tol biopolymer transport system component